MVLPPPASQFARGLCECHGSASARKGQKPAGQEVRTPQPMPCVGKAEHWGQDPPRTSEPTGAASPRPGAFSCQDHPVAPVLPTCCRADNKHTDAGKCHALCELILPAASMGQEEIKDTLLCAKPSFLLIPPGFPLRKESRCMHVEL